MMDTPTTWLYLRKSRDRHEQTDPDLLNKHRRELLRYAEQDGRTVAPEAIFEEIGSGETIRRRPVFLRLLETWERLPRAHGGVVYTTEVARLTRGLLRERGRVQDALMRARILHRARSGLYDLHVPADQFRWEIEAGFAHHELAVGKERFAKARIEMTLEGKIRTGQVPFGWKWDRNLRRPIPDPERFALLQAICRDALLLGTAALAARYGLRQTSILSLLRNPFICGQPAKRYFPHHGEREWRSGSELKPRDEWLWPEKQGEYESAISREEWEELQQVLDRRRDWNDRRDSASGWCRDILRFVGHDRRPQLGTWHGGDEPLPTYQISFPPEVRRPRLYVPRAMIHDAAEAALRALWQDRARMEGALATYRQAQVTRARQKPSDGPLDTLQAELAKERAKLDRLRDQELDVDLADVEEIASLRRRGDEQKRHAESVAARLRQAQSHQEAPAIGSLDMLLSRMPQFVEAAGAFWATAPDEVKREIVNAFLERIEVMVEPQPGRRPSRREITDVVPLPLWRE